MNIIDEINRVQYGNTLDIEVHLGCFRYTVLDFKASFVFKANSTLTLFFVSDKA